MTTDAISNKPPRDEYSERLADRQVDLTRLTRLDEWIANVRLLVFLLGAGAIWLVVSKTLPAAFLAVPLGAFAVLIVLHERTRRSMKRAARSVAFYEACLRRTDDAWMGKGFTGTDLQPPDHPYAADLDLFGPGSLYELLCTARTPSGRETLAGWLCAPTGADEAVARQQAVEELRPHVDLREDLAIEGDDVREAVRARLLRNWASAAPAYPQAWIRPAAIALTIAAVASAVVWGVTGYAAPFAVVALVEIALLRYCKSSIQQVIRDMEVPGLELSVLAHVLSRLERESFHGSLLRSLHTRLLTEGVTASDAIRKLDRLVRVLEMQNNQLFAPFALFLLWPIHSTFAIERWRHVYGARIVEWIDAVGELEAICALAAYAYEHPEDVYPEFTGQGPLFEATGIGHPLLPRGHCVRNDVHLGSPVRVLVISGSNMSGKSTLLRTCGINAVLAQAGAPVHARSLRMSPLCIGATLRVVDSIQDGASRFYAEIRRLKHVVDMARGTTPLLFLLDEILHGTNSHDRSIGAEALLRVLLEAGAIGFVTTHDLAITASAESHAPHAVNMHFEDQFADGALRFDYRLRPGVVQKSNALALMRSVGLDVPEQGA
ncbi:MAG: DNA mismatch repair protein MutS [Candidatus Hydrogenedentota bacterium]